jgi:glyoxylase-like metal-dependent hydrolase (beta-lactamase superfamily II)
MPIALAFGLALSVVLTAPSSAAPAPGATLSERSYQDARRILDEAVAAHGGAAGLRAARRFTVVQKGLRYQLFQNADPELPFDGWGLDRTAAVDLDRGRLYGEYRVAKPGSSYFWWTREFVQGDGWELIMTKKWAVPMPGPSVGAMRDWLRLLPQSLLAEALSQAPTLRAAGTDTFEGRMQDVVGFTAEGGQRLDLYFDRETRLLTKYESLYTRNTIGDTIAEFRFLGYRTQDGIPVPSRFVQYSAGTLATDAKYTKIELDSSPGDALFAVPPSFVKLSVYDAKPEVTELATGVHFLHGLPGGYNSLFVELEDSILVVEACEENSFSGISEQAVALAKKTIPGKPIRYLVLTHHHGDHSAGARAYMAEGAAIVTTPGNVRYVERLAAAPHRMSPDALARSPKTPIIEPLANRRRVIADATRPVELYDIGPLPHCREMIVAYLPNEKILFQSDLFNPVVPGGAHPIEHDAPFHGIDPESMALLLRRIQALGLDVRTIAGSHGRVATYAELVAAVRDSGATP